MRKNKILLISLIPFLAVLTAIAIASLNAARADFGPDFQTNGSTLIKYNGTDSSVLVPEGIEKLANSCFASNPLIQSVILPDTVTNIEYGAFSDCINLSNIVIPDSVTTISDSAFSNCQNLSNVSIGSGLYNLGSGVFSACSKLSDVSISDNNIFYCCEDGVIYSKKKDKLVQYLAGNNASEYLMPAEVEIIARYAFWGADSLKQVTTSSGLKKIDDYAFYNVPGLESVIIYEPVRSIELGAFESCPNLKQVIMPASVSNIHNSAFIGADPSLTFICDPNSYAYKFADSNKIKTAQTEVYKPDLTIEVSNNNQTQSTADNLDIEINLKEADDYYKESVLNGNNLGGASIVSDRAFVILGDLPVNTGKSSNSNSKDTMLLSSIDDFAFYNNSNLVAFDFEEAAADAQVIGKLAFARTAIEEIDIPSTVKTIGYGAFYHCDALSEIKIPESVTRVDAYAFDYTNFMKKFDSSDEDFLIVGDGVLIKYKGNSDEVIIPDNVKYISQYAFKDNSNVRVITFPDELLAINECAFYNCNNLMEINNLPDDCILEDNSFENCGIN